MTIKLQAILVALVASVIFIILAIDWRNQALEQKRQAAREEFLKGSTQRPKPGQYKF
jgi:hypothetical protein